MCSDKFTLITLEVLILEEEDKLSHYRNTLVFQLALRLPSWAILIHLVLSNIRIDANDTNHGMPRIRDVIAYRLIYNRFWLSTAKGSTKIYMSLRHIHQAGVVR